MSEVDCHIKSVSIGIMIEGEKDMHDTIRLKNEDRVIKKCLKKLAGEFEIRICYEASGSGHVFQRKAWYRLRIRRVIGGTEAE